MRLVVEVITIGGSLPGFLGASCSGSVYSAPVVSMSMSVVLRGMKKLQVNTDFGGSLTAVDVGTGLVYFLAVCEVLLEIHSLRLFTAPLCPSCALTFRKAFSSFSVTAYTP
jgi:hypothetical protein